MSEPVRYETCPHCGETFRAKHVEPPKPAAIVTTHEVSEVRYAVHEKRDAPEGAPRTLRVEYRVGTREWVKEWVCVEHPDGGFANRKARQWWAMRSDAPFPEDADDAKDMADDGALATPTSIDVKTGGESDFAEIVAAALPGKPKWERTAKTSGTATTQDQGQRCLGFDDDDIPF